MKGEPSFTSGVNFSLRHILLLYVTYLLTVRLDLTTENHFHWARWKKVGNPHAGKSPRGGVSLSGAAPTTTTTGCWCIIKYWYCLNRPKKNFICGMANERVQTLGVLTLQTTNMKCWHHISSGVNASSRLGGGRALWADCPPARLKRIGGVL